jgi:hypothetical protein
MSAAFLLIVLFLSLRRPRRRSRDRYEALGALPPTWRPVARTIVRTNHLPRF